MDYLALVVVLAVVAVVAFAGYGLYKGFEGFQTAVIDPVTGTTETIRETITNTVETIKEVFDTIFEAGTHTVETIIQAGTHTVEFVGGVGEGTKQLAGITGESVKETAVEQPLLFTQLMMPAAAAMIAGKIFIKSPRGQRLIAEKKERIRIKQIDENTTPLYAQFGKWEQMGRERGYAPITGESSVSARVIESYVPLHREREFGGGF